MKPVLHGIGTLLKEGVTYSFRISSSVVSVLYYVRPLRVREARAPVYSSTYTHTHTHRASHHTHKGHIKSSTQRDPAISKLLLEDKKRSTKQRKLLTFASSIGSTLYVDSSSSESESATCESSFSNAWSITSMPNFSASVTLGINSASRCSLVFS